MGSKILTGLTMLKFGAFFFLLLVETAPPVQCQTSIGNSHVTVDNVGQIYILLSNGQWIKDGREVTSWQHPKDLIPFDSAAIAIAASNIGTWDRTNPAGILFSTDEGVSPRIVTDSSWKCKAYSDTAEGPRKWPIAAGIIDHLKFFEKTYDSELNAAELGPNWSWIWGTVEKIQLGANWIWYAGVGEDRILPPNNVICMKKF